ncbi:MAG: hypothetical protein HYT11_04625, partial [Candidatus Levybacteria bacterium]|nr:hypothetical protein [Candidatus Levybacteria bacterium]
MVTWIKTHKLVVLLLLIILYLFSSRLFGLNTLSSLNMSNSYDSGYDSGLKMALPNMRGISAPDFSPPYQRESPPTSDITSRLVVQESSLSLLVKDVVATQAQIIKAAQSLGGYMVSTH